MRTEKHSHLVCCSWLSSKNDDFTHILDGTYELWWEPTKNLEKPPSTSLFLVPRAVVTEHFDTLCITRRTCSCSQHESFFTSLRKYVVPAHSDWTPVCPAPFTTPHSHFLLFLPPFFKAQKGFIKKKKVLFIINRESESYLWMRVGAMRD